MTTSVQSGDSLKIHIRGVENQVFMGEKPGVAIVIDGVPVFERTGAVNIDLDNIESIRVIKGGASYLFGDDALSGAVIITTKKGATNSGVKIDTEFGSFGYRKYLARVGFDNENYNSYLQISQRSKDGYYDESDYKARYINGKIQYYIDDTSDITFGLEYADREKNSHGTVTGVTEANTNPESTWTAGNSNVRDYASYYEVGLLKLFATYNKDFSDTQNLLVNIYQYSDNTDFLSGYADYDSSHSAVTDPKFKPNKNEYEQIQRGIKTEFRDGFSSSAYLVGLDIRANEYDNLVYYNVDWARKMGIIWRDYKAGTVVSDDTTKEGVYGVYGEYKYAFSDKLNLTTNLRLDQINLDYSDNLTANSYEKRFNQHSYRVGLNYELSNDTNIYSSVSTGFRAPSIKQLFYGYIDPSGSVESNQDLKPEEAISYDIGIKGMGLVANQKFFYDVGLFLVDRKDYIMSSVGQYGTEVAGTTSQYQNIGGMESKGLELALSSDKSKDVVARLAYTYTKAKFTKYDNYNLLLGNPYGAYTIENYNLTGNRVPRVSKHHINLSVDYKPTDSLTITPEWDFMSDYYADELNWQKIDGANVVNLLTDYKTKYKNYSINLFARVDNLFDKRYYNTARGYRDSNEDGVYNAEDLSLVVNEGRRYTLGLSVKF
jgi:iron complex outermembrane receptor protein